MQRTGTDKSARTRAPSVAVVLGADRIFDRRHQLHGDVVDPKRSRSLFQPTTALMTKRSRVWF